MNKLKPCPFCGGEADFDSYLDEDLVAVKCDYCGVKTPYKSSSEAAAYFWNKRAERTCEAVADEPAPFIEWVCSKCKQPLDKAYNYCPNCGAKVVKHDETL